MNTPNATALSLESKPGTSCLRSTCLVIMPAANPPSSRSRPRSDASSPSANTSTTIHRTASCELFSIVRSNSGIVRPDERTATQRPPPPPARRTRPGSPRCEPRSASRAPASAAGPARTRRQRQPRAGTCRTRVFSSPVSESTGSSVPIAVVASAEPTYTSETHDPGRGKHATEPVGDRERHRPADSASLSGRPECAGCRSRSRRRRTTCPDRGRRRTP